MLSKMSKSDKTMFYYLGLSLLLLIVLGVVFGVSSVKESFDGNKTKREKYCYNQGVKAARVWNKKLWKKKRGLRDFTKGELESKCKTKFGNGNRWRTTYNKEQVEDYGKTVGKAANAEWVDNNL